MYICTHLLQIIYSFMYLLIDLLIYLLIAIDYYMVSFLAYDPRATFVQTILGIII